MDRLKEIRKTRGLVLWALAAESGVNPSLISAIEKHGYKPSREVQLRLATTLGVDVAEIWPIETITEKK